MDQTLASGSAPDTDGRDWKKILLNYRDPDTTRSIIEIVTTVVPLIVVWAAAWASLSISYLLTLVFIIPASLLVLRLFMIQHDCGHGAFFHGRLVNDWVGRIIGIVTLTPYDVWRRSHAVHHATSGNLDLRGVGDIDTLTVDEYRALPRWRKLAYRLYRNPIVMFVIGPAYLFLLQHRLPIGMMRAGWQPWVSALATDLGVAAFVGGMMYLVGWKAFLIIHLPIIVLAASIGVWLFYIQHQFEDTFWAGGKEWKHSDAALYGSSHYDLPGVLKWFTANIGVHHVHHMSSRIPFYRLPEVLEDYPELKTVRRVTLWESFKHVRLKLWDTEQRRLVTFRQAESLA